MTDTKIGGVIFLVLSCTYGLMAYDIPLLFEEDSPFTSRTLPLFLSISGISISLLMMVLPSNKQEDHTVLSAFYDKDWKSVLFLSVLMLAYGFTINHLGFIVSTVLFLLIGFCILKERRLRVMLIGAVPLVLVFWLLMTQILDLYLAPGLFFTG